MYLSISPTEKTQRGAGPGRHRPSTLRRARREVGSEIADVRVSPTGKRAVFEAHGDIFTVPAENGAVRDLTQTVRRRRAHPAWSPDGKCRVLERQDRRVRAHDPQRRRVRRQSAPSPNSAPASAITPYWSPDSKKVAFIDQAMRIHVVDISPGRWPMSTRRLNWLHGNLAGFRVSWSPTAAGWRTRATCPNPQESDLHLRRRTGGAPHQVTSGYYNDRSPSFDPDGKYLYFLSGRTFAPSYSDLDNSWAYVNSTNIVVAPLRADVAVAARAAQRRRKARRRKPAAPVKDVNIDFTDFERRVEVLPAAPGNYAGLTALSGRVLYRRGAAHRRGAGPDADRRLRSERPRREDDRRQRARIRHVGRRQEASRPQRPGLVHHRPEAGAEARQEARRPATMSMTVDPSAEWHQMFNDAWRVERDYFYDPGMHGVDWNTMRSRYGKLIDDAVSRWDVSFVLGELIGELNSSHTYVQGGQYENGAATHDRTPRRRLRARGRLLLHHQDLRRRRVGQRGAVAAQAPRHQGERRRLPARRERQAARRDEGSSARRSRGSRTRSCRSP